MAVRKDYAKKFDTSRTKVKRFDAEYWPRVLLLIRSGGEGGGRIDTCRANAVYVAEVGARVRRSPEMQNEERLDALIEGARETGLTIDFLHDVSVGLSIQALRRFIGNASAMPANRKSNDSPYVFRRASAPSSDSLVPPLSQLES